MENPITEVPLRQRSTPYDFSVTINSSSRNLDIYSGRSWKCAQAAYWQAINVALFCGVEAEIDLTVTKNEQPYGAFTTRISGHKLADPIHVPAGHCINWTSGSWSGDHLYEKLLATIPGMPGPLPYSH